MRAVSKNYAKRQAEKHFYQNYDMLRYEAFQQNANDIIKQAIAMMLYALSLHGYGEKRLNRIFGYMLDILNMPDVLGKTPKADECMKYMNQKYHIDFDKVHVKLESLEEYQKK